MLNYLTMSWNHDICWQYSCVDLLLGRTKFVTNIRNLESPDAGYSTAREPYTNNTEWDDPL